MRNIIIALIIFCTSLISVYADMGRNQKCEEVQAFKVFQVLEKYILARACYSINDIVCIGHVVYFQKEKGKIYYDEQIIKLKDNECAIYVDTFQYETVDGYKTVPVVKIINAFSSYPK